MYLQYIIDLHLKKRILITEGRIFSMGDRFLQKSRGSKCIKKYMVKLIIWNSAAFAPQKYYNNRPMFLAPWHNSVFFYFRKKKS